MKNIKNMFVGREFVILPSLDEAVLASVMDYEGGAKVDEVWSGVTTLESHALACVNHAGDDE